MGRILLGQIRKLAKRLQTAESIARLDRAALRDLRSSVSDLGGRLGGLDLRCSDLTIRVGVIERRLKTVEAAVMQDGVAMADLHARVSDLERKLRSAGTEFAAHVGWSNAAIAELKSREHGPKCFCPYCVSPDPCVRCRELRPRLGCTSAPGSAECQRRRRLETLPLVSAPDYSCEACYALRSKLHPERACCTGNNAEGRRGSGCRMFREDDNLPLLPPEPRDDPKCCYMDTCGFEPNGKDCVKARRRQGITKCPRIHVPPKLEPKDFKHSLPPGKWMRIRTASGGHVVVTAEKAPDPCAGCEPGMKPEDIPCSMGFSSTNLVRCGSLGCSDRRKWIGNPHEARG